MQVALGASTDTKYLKTPEEMQEKVIGFNKGAILVNEAKRKKNEYHAVHQKLYRKNVKVKELQTKRISLVDKY